MKLDNVKMGPFTIEKKLEFDNYKLWLPNTMQVHLAFHIPRLEKTENPETNEGIQVIEEEYEYDVEKIIDKRNRNGVTEYLVR
jgi:hypothetical protein